MGILVIPVFVQDLFDNQYVRIRHFNQRNHDGFVNRIIEEGSIFVCEISDFDSPEEMSVETHQSVLFVLQMVSESFSFEIKIIDSFAFSHLR